MPTGQAKPPTPERLRRRALFYLERFAASRAHLARVLERRALRDAAALDLPAEPVRQAIAELLDELERLALIDDGVFARSRARRLAERGRSPARIAMELAAKGVPRPLAETVTEELREEVADLELETATAFARRRRVGPFATAHPGQTPDDAEKMRQKSLAAFARAGFSRAIAQRVLAAERPEDLDPES